MDRAFRKAISYLNLECIKSVGLGAKSHQHPSITMISMGMWIPWSVQTSTKTTLYSLPSQNKAPHPVCRDTVCDTVGPQCRKQPPLPTFSKPRTKLKRYRATDQKPVTHPCRRTDRKEGVMLIRGRDGWDRLPSQLALAETLKPPSIRPWIVAKLI